MTDDDNTVASVPESRPDEPESRPDTREPDTREPDTREPDKPEHDELTARITSLETLVSSLTDIVSAIVPADKPVKERKKPWITR